jgi:DNA-binding response OmpR family regulator
MVNKKKILVVDDNAVNLTTLEKELSDKYTVVPMISGRRAIKYLYCEKVDLILLDVQMPVMDGIQTLREIRTQENGITVPVIFLTANKDKKTVVEGSKLGIMDYITKPFDVKNLEQRIELVFKRIGALPFDNDELYRHLGNILLDIRVGRMKQAVASANEVLQYQVDPEISGRMTNVRNKLECGDVDGAVNAIVRIQKMLEIEMGIRVQEEEKPISSREFVERLDEIIDDLAKFKTQDAIDKCVQLKGYRLSEEVRLLLSKGIDCLKAYDDESAENILFSLRDRMTR